MALKRAILKPVALGLVFALGVGAGSISITNALADSHPQTQTQTKSKNDYPKNKVGKAYGSLAEAKSPDDAPDLISATGVDGTSGYIKSSDVFGDEPKNPQEAIEKQKKRVPGSRFIPLYDVDGQTVIGKFRVEVPDENNVTYTVKGSEVTK